MKFADLGSNLSVAAWYLLFPSHCLGCERPLAIGDMGAICRSCRDALPRLAPPQCQRCGLPLPDPTCPDCARASPAFDTARAALPYEPLVRDLIHAYKYGGRLRLVRLFGPLMAAAYQLGGDLIDADACGEVPLHPSDRRRRGRNPSAELARSVARAVGIPHRPLLRKLRRTDKQATLPSARRLASPQGAFAVRRGAVLPERYLLVDDVLTTGATASACASALRSAGVRRVTVLTLARTLTRPEG